ncbi:MAG: hypothetical protein WA086_05905, partial [Ideonella sp.]
LTSEMPNSDVSWWLDWSALPERRIWARLANLPDGTAEVLDCDGIARSFPNSTAARLWLQEDEYSSLESLLASGEVPADLRAPGATL